MFTFQSKAGLSKINNNKKPIWNISIILALDATFLFCAYSAVFDHFIWIKFLLNLLLMYFIDARDYDELTQSNQNN